jgi:D-alanyl-D-alanine carboxypeptidase
MSYSEPARSTPRGISTIVLHGLLFVVAAIVAAVGYLSPASSSSTAASPTHVPRSEDRGPRPAIANLDPVLLAALRKAETDAAGDGVEFSVNSGWRSPGRQERLLQEAVAGYGSEEEAARWVATPETSPHVSGDAIDIGPSDATAWLSEYGATYGLCQTYANEPWHYELRPDAIDHGCPAMYADPTQDPRMQQ